MKQCPASDQIIIYLYHHGSLLCLIVQYGDSAINIDDHIFEQIWDFGLDFALRQYASHF
jgi:hypothetical protein